jgi:hypothetical protein
VVITEGKALKLMKADKIGLVAKKGEEDAVILAVAPRVRVRGTGANAAEKIEAVVLPGQEEKPVYIWIAGDKTAEIKKKLRELREKLDQATEPEATELRKAIKDLEEDLAQQVVRDRVVIKRDEGKGVFYILEGKEGSGQGWVLQKADRNTITLNTITVKRDGKAAFSVAYSPGQGGQSKAVYEKIVERVKQKLPEGYTLEHEFDEKSGAINLKFTGTGTEGLPAEFVKEMIELIKGEIKQGQSEPGDGRGFTPL